MDYGIKPNVYVPTTINSNTSILYDKVIPVSRLEADIIFRTSYFKNGWGCRPLNNNELAKVFGIPTSIRVSTLTHKDFLFVPCQIMDYLINPVLKTKAQREYASLKRKELEEEEIESSVTYFPALQTSLPHSWCSGLEISDVAAKHDDAKVPIQLWDKRITLI